jgi:hypothetical protein
MSSNPIRLCAGRMMLSSVVMIAAWATQAALGIAAPAPTGAPGPALSLMPSHSTPSDKSTQTVTTKQASTPAGIEKKTDQAKPQAAGLKQPAQPEKQAEKKAEPKKDSANKEPAKKETKSEAKKPAADDVVGEPLAPGMMKLLQEEIIAGFNRRGNSGRFADFQRYMNGQVRQSAAKYTGSELAGNCRLKWYEHLMTHALTAPIEAEQFTRELHVAARDPNAGLARVLAMAAVKMDVSPRKLRKTEPPVTPQEALDRIEQAITQAQTSYCAALAPFNKSEIQEMQTSLVPVFSTQNVVGHTLSDRGTGRRLCDLIEKMDRDSLHAAADALAPIADVRFLEQLKNLPADGNVKVRGVTGTVVARIDTPSGAIIIGGKGPNTYQLDEMRDVACVIDLGGDDTYQEGTVGLDRPVLVVADLAGNDTYRGTQAGIQGGAVLGVSMLLDLAGNDTYVAQDVAQGSALAGIGILIDYAGNDRYAGIRRLQGQALGGVGLLIDRAGSDDYRAAMWGQGVGGPLGFGLCEDLAGNDHYYCGGMWRDSYPETPGLEGWGQGMGEGIRQVSNGGIGVILDGGGDDVYEFDYLSHGGGYWCGLGFARDFGGNDQRLITRLAYNGGQRTEPSYQRFGCGWGCHYAMGFLFDDSGNDVYEGTIMGTGMAWDCSLGALCDFGGNDQYKATGGTVQGEGAQMGFGILFDYNGDDVYEGYGQAYANNGISYHHLPECGGNFSFVVDYGGKDQYGCGADNNSYIQRGDSGGFLIDRPRQDEIQHTATTAKTRSQDGSGS